MFTTLISTTDLSKYLNNTNWRIIDCRFSLADTEYGRRQYHENHIPNAIYAHLNEDLSGEIIPGKTGRHPLPEIAVISQTFTKWGIDESIQVVAYYDDMGGMVAARLWWMLRWLGHQKVAVLDGGWKTWQQEDRPVSKEIPKPVAKKFTANPKANYIVDADFVFANLENPAVRLFDSRSADRYQGENETIDAVAGHIPGAISLPFAGNLGPDGKFLPREELQKRFAAHLETEAEQTIFYCGSGVSACHNLLAIQHAGLGDVLLYPGSWSDWINDPGRPVE